MLLGSTRGSTESVNFYRDVHKKGLTIIGAHDSIRQPDAGDNPRSERAARALVRHDAT